MNSKSITDAARTASLALGRSPYSKGAEKLAADLAEPETSPGYVWCRTSCDSPRKHAHPQASTTPTIRVGLGNGLEDRVVQCSWYSDGVTSNVEVSVSMLRKMIEAAETYKPGATLTGGAK